MMTPDVHNAKPEHGLSHPPGFLESLPVLQPATLLTQAASIASGAPSAAPHATAANGSTAAPPQLPYTIRALTAKQFASIHSQYLTTHAPDSVIFPFLHGLEGDNDQQNAFFASAARMAEGSFANSNGGVVNFTQSELRGIKAEVPRFRGLMWVASDEDEMEEYERAMQGRVGSCSTASAQHMGTIGSTSTHPDADVEAMSSDLDDDDDPLDDDDDYSTTSSQSDLDNFAVMPMDVDEHLDLGSDGEFDILNGRSISMDVDDDGVSALRSLTDHGEGEHMHPVIHHRPALAAIDTSAGKESHTHPHPHSHRLSNASSASSLSNASSPSTPASTLPSPSLSSPSSASSTLPTPPTPPSSLPDSVSPEKPTVGTPPLPTPSPAPPPPVTRVALTSTFRPRELLCIDRATRETRFIEPKVPDGISLRNFGIQVPIFATLSDIVVYSPRGNLQAALAVASHFAHAIEVKRAQRAARGQTDLLHYNVFVLTASPEEIDRELPNVVMRMSNEFVGSGAHTTGTDASTLSETHPANMHQPNQPGSQCQLRRANTISFAQREKDEMKDLTQATEILTFPLEDDSWRAFSATTTAVRWDSKRGQVFLGNSSDVPLPPPSSFVGGRRGSRRLGSHDGHAEAADDWHWSGNDPALGYGYDICIECDDQAPFPSQAHMHAAEEHITKLDKRWAERCLKELDATGQADAGKEIPVRPPPPANNVIHLPFPSTVAYSSNSVLPFVAWLETLLKPVQNAVTIGAVRARREMEVKANKTGRPVMRRSTHAATTGHPQMNEFGTPSSLPPPSAFPTPFLPPQTSSSSSSSSTSVNVTPIPATPNSYTRVRSTSATHLTSPAPSMQQINLRTRPLKILIYSADGYTESSSLALCILMALRHLSLPEAYLELQNEKRRSFFVYPNELGPMKRIEARLERELSGVSGPGPMGNGLMRYGRPPALSVSFAPGSAPTAFLASAGPSPAPGMRMDVPEQQLSSSVPSKSVHGIVGRPRASTLPALSTPHDHQIWFNDPRFDGSFPSRVLPFLYLGNLNHAANAYMLHALGITHVVSVGECALIPPEGGNGAYASGLATAKPGSLWIEEKEGRIKVLDIKGVCDDGIDSLEPQLPPICEWIDQARKEGGKVLVHCRVGVSRSATVTIAYVMKHLGIPLVDAYLIVRSRRLSVLIQPNMRLLYNLLGWEIKLAQERAGGDEEKLRAELARCLNWPYLAKEVHALNEKYLR